MWGSTGFGALQSHPTFSSITSMSGIQARQTQTQSHYQCWDNLRKSTQFNELCVTCQQNTTVFLDWEKVWLSSGVTMGSAQMLIISLFFCVYLISRSCTSVPKYRLNLSKLTSLIFQAKTLRAKELISVAEHSPNLYTSWVQFLAPNIQNSCLPPNHS